MNLPVTQIRLTSKFKKGKHKGKTLQQVYNEGDYTYLKWYWEKEKTPFTRSARLLIHEARKALKNES